MMNSDDSVASSGVGGLSNKEEEDDASFQPSDEAKNEIEEIKKMIKDETRIVLAWRMVVIVAMLLVSTGVTCATYFFLSKQEDDEYESSYDQIVSTMMDSMLSRVDSIRSSYKNFGDQLTSVALTEGSEWPFFTYEHFNQIAQNAEVQTGALGVWMLPLISEAETAEWSHYVMTHKDWFGEELSSQIPPVIHTSTANGPMTMADYPGPYAPLWQLHPLPAYSLMNFDLIPISAELEEGIRVVEKLGDGVITNSFSTALIEPLWPFLSKIRSHPNETLSIYMQPVFDDFNKSRLASVALFFLPWGSFFTNSMPDSVRGIHLVLNNSCGEAITWELQGNKAVFAGLGDLHDTDYDSHKVHSPLGLFEDDELAAELGVCFFTLNFYPSSVFEDDYISNRPVISTVIVGAVFISIMAAFLAYDSFQRRRNTKVIIMSLFPSTVRDRILEPVRAKKESKKSKNDPFSYSSSDKKQLQNFLDGHHEREQAATMGTKSIADLFLETTIMFADITNFTAWSSVREPTQVFTLLETVFSALDRIAKRRGVYKVETVGDCYVAVVGLPVPRKDHAVVMAKFARDALVTVKDLVKQLELTLGPDTGELGIRIGLHSGPVTAGVLRGDRARFQLFGDTMNTTARIESTGTRNRIHMSKETADLLSSAGKGHWIQARQDLVTAKGKGTMKTYWLNPLEIKDSYPVALSTSSCSQSEYDNVNTTPDQDEIASIHKHNRLIDWQVDMFVGLLKHVVARRNACKKLTTTATLDKDKLDWKPASGKICLDEVKEIIELPEFNARAARSKEDPSKIDLGLLVVEQLRTYISTIARSYRQNHFHNFAHACHVTMSVKKLLSRIEAPEGLEDSILDNGRKSIPEEPRDSRMKGKIASSLHDHTYGITSDPLTQFAMVFSALIHDVDHMGVPNEVLVKEEESLANKYRSKSVAEQHSIDVAWNLLQEEQFKELRGCIYATKSEFYRFRQLVVQAVLATDIVDKELKSLRNARWDSAFADSHREENPRDTVNRKATIVIEHLIQASDVAHTMQHWHIYRKWNENFFRECYQAYKLGRTDKNPVSYWYKGELGFFDFYIIPLAKKLKKCGVFGVASDEYLNYALKNRQEWEDRGQQVLEEMIQSMNPSEAQEKTMDNSKTKNDTLTNTNEVASYSSPSNATIVGVKSPSYQAKIYSPPMISENKVDAPFQEKSFVLAQTVTHHQGPGGSAYSDNLLSDAVVLASLQEQEVFVEEDEDFPN